MTVNKQIYSLRLNFVVHHLLCQTFIEVYDTLAEAFFKLKKMAQEKIENVFSKLYSILLIDEPILLQLILTDFCEV